MQPGKGKYVRRKARTCTWLSLASRRFCSTGTSANGHNRLHSNTATHNVAAASISIKAILPDRPRPLRCCACNLAADKTAAEGMNLGGQSMHRGCCRKLLGSARRDPVMLSAHTVTSVTLARRLSLQGKLNLFLK